MTTNAVMQLCWQIVEMLIDKVMEEVVHLCPICLEEIQEDEHNALPCHHKLHIKCAEAWFAVKLNCPVCRLKFDFRAYALPGRTLRKAESRSDDSTISTVTDSDESQDQDSELEGYRESSSLSASSS